MARIPSGGGGQPDCVSCSHVCSGWKRHTEWRHCRLVHLLCLTGKPKTRMGKDQACLFIHMSVCFCGHLFYVSVRSFAEKYDGSIRIKFWALGNVLVFVDEQDPLNLRTIWYIVCTQSIDYLLFVVRRFIP